MLRSRRMLTSETYCECRKSLYKCSHIQYIWQQLNVCYRFSDVIFENVKLSIRYFSTSKTRLYQLAYLVDRILTIPICLEIFKVEEMNGGDKNCIINFISIFCVMTQVQVKAIFWRTAPFRGTMIFPQNSKFVSQQTVNFLLVPAVYLGMVTDRWFARFSKHFNLFGNIL